MEVRTVEGNFDGKGLRMAVVVGRFNDLLTGEMLGGALDCFRGTTLMPLTSSRFPVPSRYPSLPKSSPRAEDTTRF